MGEIWNYLRGESPPGLALSLIIGASLGSFANVVIHRLPRRESLLQPGSRCPHCGAPISPLRNIPILSYFMLKGKTACCGNSIAPRYVVIETLCALALGSLYIVEGWNPRFGFAGAWAILLIILSAIDLEHYRLPNVLVGAGAMLSLLWMILAPEITWAQAGIGLVGALVISGVMLLTGRRATGQWGGWGDVKLIAVLGFTFGLGQFLLLILAASMSAMLFAAIRRKPAEGRRIPFGPFLAVGAWVAIWCGETIVRWYLGVLDLGF
ncbi:MAG TPA: prepilin peptidase [bacterium]